MADRALTFMTVHAHPDDEATGTGGVLARYASEGIRTVLVTCTDGGCGDGPGGVKPGQPGHDPAAVAAIRSTELKASCAALNISDLETLDYADSGMLGWAENEAPHAFWNTPVAEAAQRLAELIDRYQPDVVATYDPYGFYGHPDHIQAHRITMAALELTGSPAKVYWTTAPRSAMEKFGAVMREFGDDFPEPEEGAEPSGWPPSSPTSSWPACPTRRSRPGSTSGPSATRSSTPWPPTPARATRSSSSVWAVSGSAT